MEKFISVSLNQRKTMDLQILKEKNFRFKNTENRYRVTISLLLF